MNGPLVWLPGCFSTELSLVLGTIIADRLPTQEARRWHKALEPWGEYSKDIGRLKTVPDVSWPIETVLFVHPNNKRAYGSDELILWELTLLGKSADHGLFLEILLPAMEEAATTTDPRWHSQNSLWGRFDIYAVYAARGATWETVVQEGKLDLHYRATPSQWAEGLTFDPQTKRVFDRLTWITPFDLSTGRKGKAHAFPGKKKTPPAQEVPNLQRLLESLITRMSLFLPGKHNTPADVWNSLNPEERYSLQAAMEQAARIPIHHHDLHPAPKNWPGRWTGTQVFPSIPTPIIPYLELASILHIGRQTHFGCGTFVIT
ncbi:MAG: CRISPR system precrRNA processing endoribonuclease RAMP protein Cas6 [Anaerolineae bacterium]|nr:CRISPR system precrRNA processing endoribonuclease RAMP protein Cas6 [Anaerolineae bacterium]MDH7473639.1 CRISPR system precrRNA processing endoribonuclease RAMP protein Cas6 [Anaerolineae bacterium]